ncbi:MAG: hypothetical protein HC941_29125 [Microcoleus sp. SU_5_3]|nr:hypothetical protein [Microcoleus sp. SU_5_3]
MGIRADYSEPERQRADADREREHKEYEVPQNLRNYHGKIECIGEVVPADRTVFFA